MFDRHAVLDFELNRSLSKYFGRIALFVGVALAVFADPARTTAASFEIGDMCSLIVGDADERGGKARRFDVLRYDQRHRLTAEPDLTIVQRPERRTGRCNVVAILFIRGGHFWPVVVREYFEDARHRQSVPSVDAPDAAPGDRRGDDKAVCQARYVMFGGVFRGASDFGVAIDP